LSFIEAVVGAAPIQRSLARNVNRLSGTLTKKFRTAWKSCLPGNSEGTAEMISGVRQAEEQGAKGHWLRRTNQPVGVNRLLTRAALLRTNSKMENQKNRRCFGIGDFF
jgi:hypothetical protein